MGGKGACCLSEAVLDPFRTARWPVKIQVHLRHSGDWQDAGDELGYAFFKNWN